LCFNYLIIVYFIISNKNAQQFYTRSHQQLISDCRLAQRLSFDNVISSWEQQQKVSQSERSAIDKNRIINCQIKS